MSLLRSLISVCIYFTTLKWSLIFQDILQQSYLNDGSRSQKSVSDRLKLVLLMYSLISDYVSPKNIFKLSLSSLSLLWIFCSPISQVCGSILRQQAQAASHHKTSPLAQNCPHYILSHFQLFTLPSTDLKESHTFAYNCQQYLLRI